MHIVGEFVARKSWIPDTTPGFENTKVILRHNTFLGSRDENGQTLADHGKEGGVVITQGDSTVYPFEIHDNEFIGLEQAIFTVGGGISGPIDIYENEIKACRSALVFTGNGTREDGNWLGEPETQNLTFRHNRVRAGHNGDSLFDYGMWPVKNSSIHDNDFYGNGIGVLARASYYGSVDPLVHSPQFGITVSGNRFYDALGVACNTNANHDRWVTMRPFWIDNTYDQYLMDGVGNVTVEYLHFADGLSPRLSNINPNSEHHDVASDIDRVAEMSVKGYTVGQRVTLHRSWWHAGIISFLPDQETYTVAQEVSLAVGGDSLTLVFDGSKWLDESLVAPQKLLLSMGFENNLIDDSPYHHGASWQKGPSFGPGSSGTGIELKALGRKESNGITLSKDHVEDFAGLQSLNIKVQANKDNDAKIYEILRFHAVYDLSLKPGNKVSFRVWDHEGQVAVFAAVSPVPVGQWGQYEVDWDGQTMKILVDGQEILSQAWQREGLRTRSYYNNVVIGRNPWGDAFAGRIDELQIRTNVE